MILKSITYFGQPATVACDDNCSKAWGLNSRPRVRLSTNDDDFVYLADGELVEAPTDPGTYEGCDAKPTTPAEKMNRWCVRECERCVMTDLGKSEDIPTLPDFSKRIYNIPEKYHQ